MLEIRETLEKWERGWWVNIPLFWGSPKCLEAEAGGAVALRGDDCKSNGYGINDESSERCPVGDAQRREVSHSVAIMFGRLRAHASGKPSTPFGE